MLCVQSLENTKNDLIVTGVVDGLEAEFKFPTSHPALTMSSDTLTLAEMQTMKYEENDFLSLATVNKNILLSFIHFIFCAPK